MPTLLSLPPELHLKIFKRLSDKGTLLSLILSCKTLNRSFLDGHLGTILERIRFNELAYGTYAKALLFSLRLMEPDVGVSQVRAWGNSFKAATSIHNPEESWLEFQDSLKGRKSLDDFSQHQFHSDASFCSYNRLGIGLINPNKQKLLEPVILQPTEFYNRWAMNYRRVRLLAYQCCITRLHQGFEVEMEDYLRPSLETDQPPPTDSELRRTENGVFVLWIMYNIASLIHRPDFLEKEGLDRAARTKMQRDIRRAVISAFRVWDWRVAMSIRAYIQARLGHLDTKFPEYKSTTWEIQKQARVDCCMWDNLPVQMRYSGNPDQVSDCIIAAMSPPGAMRYFFSDRVIVVNDQNRPENRRHYGRGVLEDSRLLKNFVLEVEKSQTHWITIEHLISGFDDFEPFFRRIKAWNEHLLFHDDINTFYPPDQYPNRNKLPLETTRSIVKPGRVVYYGAKTCQQLSDTIEDDGWAWTKCIDWNRCMWDDWRLEKYAGYCKPIMR